MNPKKNMNRSLIIFAISLFVSVTLSAQTHEHDHPQNEIGLSGGASFCPDHKEWGGGIHAHYFRTLGLHSKWSLGGGVEQVWSDGTHFNISAGAKYEIIEDLSLGVLPGITFLKHNEDPGSSFHSQFAVHCELVYACFRFGDFHAGPAIDYSWSKEDSHIMLGIHLAYGF